MESSGLFRAAKTPIHALNPFTKVVLALCFSFSVFFADSIWVPLGLVFVTALLLGIARALKDVGLVLLKYLSVMIVILFVIQCFWYTGGESALWSLGPLTIKTEGFLFASLVTLRLLTVLGGFYLMMVTTHPSDLVIDLEQRGMHAKLAYVILATMQSLGEMQQRSQVIMEVQQSRGVETKGSLITRAKAFIPLIGPLIIGSILNIESRALALEVRGFSSSKAKTYLKKFPEEKWEKTARWVLVIFTGLVLVLRWVL